jgi:hypothetical protein
MRVLLPRASLQLLPVLAASISLACGGAGEPHPERAPGDPSIEQSGLEVEASATAQETSDEQDETSASGGQCADGDWKECRVKLPKQGDVENCFVGVRLCTDGVWSACQ